MESDDMTYEAPLDREICLMGLNYIQNKDFNNKGEFEDAEL